MASSSFYLLVFGFVCVMAQDSTTVHPTKRPPPNFVTTLTKLGGFGQILSLLNSTGLTQTLLREPEVTLFLPDNDALNKLPASYLASLQKDPQKLEALLSYHVVEDSIRKLGNDMVLYSIDGKPIRINSYGILHKRSAEGVEITRSGIHMLNGYIHVIDGLMVPPEGDIIDIILNRPDMTTLKNLIQKAGLVDLIKADQNITLFAPTNAAWAKLDPQVMTYFDYNPETLKEVLLYHIVNRLSLYSIGMRHTMTVNSADGHHDSLMLLENGNDIYLNHAKITEKDISATNGVLHAIDDILIPLRTILEIEKQGMGVVG